MEWITTYICEKFDIGGHDNMFGGALMPLIAVKASSRRKKPMGKNRSAL